MLMGGPKKTVGGKAAQPAETETIEELAGPAAQGPVKEEAAKPVPRPKGRSPPGKTWDAQAGEWVEKETKASKKQAAKKVAPSPREAPPMVDLTTEPGDVAEGEVAPAATVAEVPKPKAKPPPLADPKQAAATFAMLMKPKPKAEAEPALGSKAAKKKAGTGTKKEAAPKKRKAVTEEPPTAEPKAEPAGQAPSEGEPERKPKASFPFQLQQASAAASPQKKKAKKEAKKPKPPSADAAKDSPAKRRSTRSRPSVEEPDEAQAGSSPVLGSPEAVIDVDGGDCAANAIDVDEEAAQASPRKPRVVAAVLPPPRVPQANS